MDAVIHKGGNHVHKCFQLERLRVRRDQSAHFPVGRRPGHAAVPDTGPDSALVRRHEARELCRNWTAMNPGPFNTGFGEQRNRKPA